MEHLTRWTLCYFRCPGVCCFGE